VRYYYDSNNRRIKRQHVTTAITKTTAYLYDGWNVLQEKTFNSHSAISSYRNLIWGIDISNTLQGAGGIGGLLRVLENDGTTIDSSFYIYDAMGNVSDLIGESGNVRAHYSYDSFGKEIEATGSHSRVNAYRFNTRYHDDETQLAYYGYRYYDNIRGRWINRDSAEELGGVNIYSITENDLVNKWDFLGFGPLDKLRELYGEIDSLIEDAINEVDLRITYTPAPNKTVTPWELGFEWLMGLGPRHREFTDGDAFAEQMRRHSHIQDKIKPVWEMIKKNCQTCAPTTIETADAYGNYKLDGIAGIGKYMQDYSSLLSAGLLGNLAVTFIGSYGAKFELTSMSCCEGRATMRITIDNKSHAASALRPPYLGYTGWWNTHIAPKVDRLFKKGPGAETTQKIVLHEEFTFPANKNCSDK
jgi:RHS repeat-associated protein